MQPLSLRLLSKKLKTRLRSEAMLFNAAITEEQVGYIYSLNYRAKGGRQNALRRYPGTPDASRLPSSLVGFWPLDGDGSDLGPHSMTGTQTGGCFTTGYHEAVEVCGQNWVAGKYRIALNFKGDDGFIVSDPSNALASINAEVTMAAWVRPSQYETCGDRGIIMNKEGCAPDPVVFVVCCLPCRFVCLVYAVFCQSQSGLDPSAARMVSS